ncbi:hypothetical protein LTR85_000282 [Meristemomyces frigidus]|nr:hypothetical protein LTR85_000282 [Meristemomyces frigidus]
MEYQKLIYRPESDQVVCGACENFERHSVAQLYLNRQSGQHQTYTRVKLHENFRALEESFCRGCHLCRCWMLALLDECFSPTLRTALRSSNNLVYVSTPVPQEIPRPGENLGKEAQFVRVLCVFDSNVQLEQGLRHSAVERKSRSKKLTDKVSGWIDDCNRLHAACTRHTEGAILPRRLLDVRSQRVKVVDGSTFTNISYLALSYCWGGDQDVKLTFQREQSLRDGLDRRDFAETIQDAIWLCQMLRIDYMWVDALCIMQDDNGQDWNSEAYNMPHIYGNAYITLSVCSASSASEGFARDRWSVEGCERFVPEFIPGSGRYLQPPQKTLEEIRAKSPLATRGWVFQEELLSPRILYWSDHGLFWSCLSGTRSEIDYHDHLHPAPPRASYPHTFLKAPDPLLRWDDMITSFSRRDFTIESDRLPAVSGLAALIQQKTGDEYLLGLWRSRLPAQLLWVVTSPPLLRERTANASQRAAPPPSWSWAAIATTRVIRMSEQTVARAQLIEAIKYGSTVHLHLTGRVKSLVEGFRQVKALPEELDTTDHERLFQGDSGGLLVGSRQEITVLNDARHPVSIQLDGELPETFDDLVCFEINYMSFLLLQPVDDGLYERIGCAQRHQDPQFFGTAKETRIVLK